MFRKSFGKFFLVAAVAAFGAGSISAQSTQPVSGTVEVVNANGTRSPVAGALVECFRADIKSNLPAATTNAKGQFGFAGLQSGFPYILSISGPGIAPTYIPNIKAGQEKILISTTPGDGSKITEEQIRTSANKVATAGSVEAAAAQNKEELKKAQAEYEAQKKKVEDKNKKAAQANEITTRAIKEGKEALEAKNYDVAIAKYQEGFEADPEFVGSAPIFLLNKGVAHTQRAVDTHNASVKLTDPAEKVAAGAKVKQDLLDAVQGYLKAINIQKNAPAAEIGDKANFDATRLSLLRASAEALKRAVETERVDPGLIEAAKVLIPEYMLVETDNAKKMALNVTLADMYRIGEDRESAIAGYKKVLEMSPDNVDALAYVGIVLVDLGWLKDNDKALSQEGANYLQKFVSVAPDTHKLKSGAVEYLNILKAQSIVPVKAAAAPKKKP